eukprot:gene5073-34871_t
MALDAGALKVTIETASGLKDKDLFGKSDPYALLKCGGQQFRSKTCKGGGKAPVWNETFTFQIITENTLDVTIMDDDMIRDALLGTASISLAKVRVQTRDKVEQRGWLGPHVACVLNFCANNYLGLSNHPALSQAAIEAIKTHGYGLSSVRFICGTQDLHKQLEHKISEFHQTEDTILYPSCFDANAGLFEALLGAEDAVISDELNHASIIDGIRLSKAQRFRYKHLDLVDLDNKQNNTF